jgi:general secretion pathway protein C
MQEFFRRNFWTVHLAFIGVGAYLLAGVLTEVAAIAFLSPGPPAAKDAKDAPTPAAPSRSVKPASKVSLGTTSAGHNVFDAEPKVALEGEEGDNPENGTQQTSMADLGVDLLGTLVSPTPEWSMATIRVQNASQLVRIGTPLQDKVEVADIAERYIVLTDGTNRQVIRLWAEKAKPGSARPGIAAAKPAIGPPPAVGPSGGDFAKGVKKVGTFEYQIDKGMLEETLGDLTKLGMQARIVPNYEDGKYHGFRLVGIRPDSLYRAIGLESGDLVRRVNGQDIDTPNKAISLFEQLRSSPMITLDVDRRGQKTTMTYSIK